MADNVAFRVDEMTISVVFRLCRRHEALFACLHIDANSPRPSHTNRQSIYKALKRTEGNAHGVIRLF